MLVLVCREFYVNVNEVNPEPILLCCVVMEISTGWGRFGGGGFDPSLAVS